MRMNEEDLKLVKQLVKETIAETLDIEVWDAIFRLVNAIETGIAELKQHVGMKNVSPEPSWNPERIKWEKAEGPSGLYERSIDTNNPEFKAMLRDLAAHNGRLTRDGYFYWVFKNGSTVGRRRRG
jgi:hypothetical protein